MSTVATTTVSNAERIGKAVAEIAKRVRIQNFDVIGISGTTFGAADTVKVSIQVDTRRDMNRAAAYFQLTGVRDLGHDTTIIGPNPVTALHGAVVEVFGPTTIDGKGASDR